MRTAHARSPFESRATARPASQAVSGIEITDLTLQPRTGFKGRGTRSWLTPRLDRMPPQANQATMQADGTLVAWLGGEEYLLLAAADCKSETVSRLMRDWHADYAAGQALIGFPLPRADSHSWLRLIGSDVPAMMAKICGVDLRPRFFSEEAVAQTIVARIGAILIRQDHGGTYGLHILTDFASAQYFREVLEDAAEEFGGGIV